MNQKHKYHLKGIGGRPSKQMKEMQGKPLPDIFFKNKPDYPKDEEELDKRMSEVKLLCKPKPNLTKPSEKP